MGQVISLEDSILEKECKNPFNPNSSVSMSMTPEICYALAFIGRYNNSVEDDECFSLPVNISIYAFDIYYRNGVFDDFLQKFIVNWEPEDKEKNRIYGICQVSNPDFFNLMLNEKKYIPQNVFNLVFHFYIQSFIDSYNGEKQEYGILFDDKIMTRKKAMQFGDQGLIEILNNVKYIDSFTKDGIVMRHN